MSARDVVRRVGVGVALLAAVGAVALRAAGDEERTSAQPSGFDWRLVWSDEFDGAAQTPPDPSRWGHDVGGSGWGNRHLEHDTTDTRNVAHDGKGNLVITARRDGAQAYQCSYGTCAYTSGRIKTAGKVTAHYGRVEARMRVPAGTGLWPAFWMLGSDLETAGWPGSGEIDVMENVGHEPGTVHGSLHGPGYSAGDSLTGSYTLPDGERLSDGFHTYAVEWAPGSVVFSVDGVRYATRTAADTGGRPWVFDHPFFLILNLAVGGSWPGDPGPDTVFPAQLVVDRVAVYEALPADAHRSGYETIEAESYDAAAGAVVQDSARARGGAAVGRLARGDWLALADVSLARGATRVQVGVASGSPVRGRVEVRLDALSGPPVAVLDIPDTGGWQQWTTVEADLPVQTAGAHHVYLRLVGETAEDLVDIDWIRFAPRTVEAAGAR